MSQLLPVVQHASAVVGELTVNLAFRVEDARHRLWIVLLESDLAAGYVAQQLLAVQTGNGYSDMLLVKNDDSHKYLLQDFVTELTGQAIGVGSLVCGHNDDVQHLDFVQLAVVGSEKVEMSALARQIMSRLHFLPVYLIHVSECIEDKLADEGDCDQAYKARLQVCRQELKRSRQGLIAANTGLVAFVAHKYKATSLSFDDLIQEGMVGLIKAVDRFDPERGICFSTYAIFWIRQAISRLIIKQDKVVPLPVALAERSSPVFEVMRNIYLQHQRWPTLVELKVCCDLSEQEIKAISSYYLSTYVNEGHTDEEDDDGMSMMEKIRQHQFAQPLDDLIATDLVSYVDKAIATLPEKQASILTMRIGLGNHAEMTLQAIADHLQVTRERVRQIQNEALKKLKSQFGFDLMLFLEPKDT